MQEKIGAFSACFLGIMETLFPLKTPDVKKRVDGSSVDFLCQWGTPDSYILCQEAELLWALCLQGQKVANLSLLFSHAKKEILPSSFLKRGWSHTFMPVPPPTSFTEGCNLCLRSHWIKICILCDCVCIYECVPYQFHRRLQPQAVVE